jgi:hypothetical protein
MGGGGPAGLGGQPDRDLSPAFYPERAGPVGDCDGTGAMLRACTVVPLACRLTERMTAPGPSRTFRHVRCLL